MFRTIRTLTIASAVLAVASLAGAQAAPAAPAKSAPAKTETAKSSTSKKSASTSMSLTGKVAKFDAASNMLTVTTAKGDVDVNVPASASLKEGTTTVQASSLATMTGHQVRVQYTDNAGTKTAQTVKISAATASSKGASSKAPAKSTTAAPKK
jgi:hypothetical protein